MADDASVRLTFIGSKGLELGRQLLSDVEAAVANLEAWRAGLGEFAGRTPFTEGCGTGVTVPDGVQVEIRIGARH